MVARGKTSRSITYHAGETDFTVSCPYNEEFVAGAKKLGGRWDPAGKVWVFHPLDAERVKALVDAIYPSAVKEEVAPPVIAQAVDAFRKRRVEEVWASLQNLDVAEKAIIRQRFMDEYDQALSRLERLGFDFGDPNFDWGSEDD